MDELIGATRQSCHALDTLVRRKQGELDKLEAGCQQLTAAASARSAELERAGGAAQAALQAADDAIAGHAARLSAACEHAAAEASVWQRELRDEEDLLARAGTATEQAGAALLPTARGWLAELVRELDALEQAADHTLAELERELMVAEAATRGVAEAAQSGRAELEAGLAECARQADALLHSCSQSAAGWSAALHGLSSEVEAGSARADEHLRAAAGRAGARLEQSLARDPGSELELHALRAEEGVADWGERCARAGALSQTEAESLRSGVGQLCDALDPLLAVSRQAGRLELA